MSHARYAHDSFEFHQPTYQFSQLLSVSHRYVKGTDGFEIFCGSHLRIVNIHSVS